MYKVRVEAEVNEVRREREEIKVENKMKDV